MKEKTHPPYQEVLFVDSSTGVKYVIGSTMPLKEKAMHEGVEYPLCRVSISSSSHPFFTGSTQMLDSEGRVDKFTKRYQRKAESVKVDQAKKEEAKKAKAKAPLKKK